MVFDLIELLKNNELKIPTKKLAPNNFWEKESRIFLRLLIIELIFGVITAGGITFIIASNRGWLTGLSANTFLTVIFYLIYIIIIISLLYISLLGPGTLMYAFMYKVTRYNKIKTLKDEGKYFEIISMVNEGKYHIPKLIFTLPISFVYNDPRCLLAALSEFNEKNVEEALLTLIREKPRIRRFALEALGVLAVKNGFEYFEDYFAYLENRRKDALQKL
ncbi:MAG: hypothetical protein FK734_00750 [Asgard group archaeon]|nr:hypothetical protein [Asgard group archaeon]